MEFNGNIEITNGWVTYLSSLLSLFGTKVNNDHLSEF